MRLFDKSKWIYAKNLMKTLSNNPSENRVKTLWKDMHLMIAQMDIWRGKAQLFTSCKVTNCWFNIIKHEEFTYMLVNHEKLPSQIPKLSFLLFESCILYGIKTKHQQTWFYILEIWYTTGSRKISFSKIYSNWILTDHRTDLSTAFPSSVCNSKE